MKLRVYACQYHIVWESPEVNRRQVRTLLEKAEPAAHSLIVLPEMFAVGFSMNTAKVAERPSGAAFKFLGEIARRWRCAVVGGVPVRQGGRNFNEAVCFDAAGRLRTRYAKTHVFNPGGEGRHYHRGSRLRLFSWRGAKVAPFVCYDLRFPEIFGAVRRWGAELMVVIASWPAPRDAHWQTLLRARAIENQAYVLGVNRIGTDPHSEYAGNSSVYAPNGELIAFAGSREGVLVADLDIVQCRTYRRTFPVFQDRRRCLRVVA
jgi:predicted amidohydrolase